MQYIVKHKNPNHPAIVKGDLWASDGPFDNDVELAQHLNRCEYAQRGIPFEIVEINDEQTNKLESPKNESKKTTKSSRSKRAGTSV
jgi:hypothetical protein